MARTASRARPGTKRPLAKTARAKSVAGGRSSAKAAPAKKKTAARRSAGKIAGTVRIAKTTASAKSQRGRKAAPLKRKAATPQRAARKVATRQPSPRKAAAPAAVPQQFAVSHLNEADFKADGLRAYAKYRDLGFAEATGGLCQAHVIRFQPPCTDDVRKRHSHNVDLQLVYVLKGWVKNEFEGHGEQMMSVGSCWLQPSGVAHTVLEFSPDCELLEIIVPADFRTDELT